MGTVAYMSPEQVRGQELDERTDVFSLGVVIYEMLTSALPFSGATDGVVFDAILNKPPAPLPASVPVELSRIVDKALEKDRELRYQSVRELRADVARLKRDSSSRGSMPAVPAASPVPTRTARQWWLVAAAAVVVAAAAIVGFLVWPSVPESPNTGSARLTRLTFDEGLQVQPTWSPDGRFVAYASNQSGSFDIWVQPIGGGRAVQVTTDPTVDWQPAWSPDGNNLAFRSERGGGGIFVVPALGGRERQLAPFGYAPQWSPDGSKILVALQAPFESASRVIPHVFLLDPKGSAPVRILSDDLAGFTNIGRIGWHPDGRRVSFLAAKGGTVGFWTASVAGGAVVKAEMSAEVQRQLTDQLDGVLTAKWAPAGDAVYLEAHSQRIANLWSVDVDPRTLRWLSGPTRLTTGPGIDSDVAITADGSKLAFVTRSVTSRLWSLPFDAGSRSVTGEGEPVTPANVQAAAFDLSPDGRLLYVASRPGKALQELWAGSLAGDAPVLLTEAQLFFAPRVARDGTRVGYRIRESDSVPRRVKWRAIAGGPEHVMMDGTSTLWDWSPDAAQVLILCPPPVQTGSLCVAPPSATTNDAARPLVVDADYNIWQGRYSPDGAWVLFNAQSRKQPGVSILGVVPAAGGRWTPLTDATLWSDKARWGPDGRTIYFISNRDSAFFNVWAVPFDPETGTLAGKESRVTHYDHPGRSVAATGASELGVNATRLVVPITEVSGSIWMLDGIRTRR
jgi:Tol biopolymer transport system component